MAAICGGEGGGGGGRMREDELKISRDGVDGGLKLSYSS